MSEMLQRILNIIDKVEDNELKLQQILDYLETEVVDEEEEYEHNPIDELPEKFRPMVNELAQYMDMELV